MRRRFLKKEQEKNQSSWMPDMYVDENDRKQITALSKIVKPEWKFLDIGVCQGALLLPMSKMMSYGWGFEAKPSNMNLLHKYFSGVNNVEIHNKAVSDTNGKIKFYQGRDAHTGSLNEKFIENLLGSHALSNTIEVESITLDYFLHDKDVDIIKIDVEGGEYLVFEGAKNILENRDIIWLVEFHNSDDWEQRQFLYEHGYDFFDRDTFQKLDRKCHRPYQCFIAREEKIKSLTRV